MISDAQKALLTHAANVLRATADVITQAYDEAGEIIVSTIIDARDTADKLDAMVTPKKSNGHSHEVGSCDCDKPGFQETEMA